MNGSQLSVHAGHYRWGIGAIIAFFLLCGSLLSLLPTREVAAVTTVPTKINFQGRLTDSSGNVLANGQYNMTFRLYTASSGGSAVWTEVRGEGASPIQVTNGLFSVQLGDVTPIPASLFASGSLYFEIDLPSPATATCTTASCADYASTSPLSPRNPLATSAYAFNSETLDGLDSAAFVQNAANNTLTGSNLFKTTGATAVQIQNAGGTDLFTADTSGMKVGIGLANPSLGRLHVTWLSGDSGLAAIYGGSSSGSNNQIGVYGRSGSGVGIQGVSGTGTGVQGSSTSNVGVAGTSVSSIGVQGRSDTSTSGLFVSTNILGTNSSTTLVTRASTNQTSDLFQAQDSGNVALFKINADGSVRTKTVTGTDSATAFVIQDAGGNEMLTADSVSDRMYIGDTTADGVGVTLVLDTKNTAGDPTGVNGAMYYNSNANKMRCYVNSAWRDCDDAQTLDGIDSTALAQLTASNTFTGNNLFKTTSATAFRVQDALSADLLVADTSGSLVKIGNPGTASLSGVRLLTTLAEVTTTLRIGTATNGVEFSGTSAPVFMGTARPTRSITLAPEFAGATFRGDGSNNNGSLSSDFCSEPGWLNINPSVCSTSSEEHNYYEWTTSQASAQDYDIYVHYQLPSDYDTGSMTNLTFAAQGTNASQGATLTLYKDGSQCSTTGDVVTGGAAEWQSGFVASPLGLCSISAGGRVVFKISVSATQSQFVRAGEINFSYRSKF